MKLSLVMLADHGSVREGTLGVLGGFVNQLWRNEFPAAMGVDLVAVAMTSPEERAAGGASDTFRFWCEEPGVEEPLFEGRGEISSGFDAGMESYFPMIFDLRNAQLPKPGRYQINFQLSDGEVLNYAFYADTPPSVS